METWPGLSLLFQPRVSVYVSVKALVMCATVALINKTMMVGLKEGTFYISSATNYDVKSCFNLKQLVLQYVTIQCYML